VADVEAGSWVRVGDGTGLRLERSTSEPPQGHLDLYLRSCKVCLGLPAALQLSFSGHDCWGMEVAKQLTPSFRMANNLEKK